MMALIASEQTYWTNWPPANGVVAGPRDPEHDDFELSRLTRPDPDAYWRSWLMSDPVIVRSTLERVEHDGRTAWRFVAPEVKAARVLLTVDEGTGLVMRAEHPEVGVYEEWLDVSEEVPGDETFAYGGEWKRAEEFSGRYPHGWHPK